MRVLERNPQLEAGGEGGGAAFGQRDEAVVVVVLVLIADACAQPAENVKYKAVAHPLVAYASHDGEAVVVQPFHAIFRIVAEGGEGRLRLEIKAFQTVSWRVGATIYLSRVIYDFVCHPAQSSSGTVVVEPVAAPTDDAASDFNTVGNVETILDEGSFVSQFGGAAEQGEHGHFQVILVKVAWNFAAGFRGVVLLRLRPRKAAEQQAGDELFHGCRFWFDVSWSDAVCAEACASKCCL